MFCRNCGADVAENQVQCPKCGTIVEEVQQMKHVVHCVSAKNRNTAMLLAIISCLGIGGLHRMYTGHYAIGVLYALTFNVFYLGAIYDLWCLYNESYTDADGFPVVADTDYYSNYKRRPLSNDKSIAFIVGVFVVIFIVIPLLGGAIVYTIDK